MLRAARPPRMAFVSEPPPTAPPETTPAALEAAIALLEAQRAALGDAVVEMALQPLRRQLAARQGLGGLQLRLVTILFVDIAGSTALAHQLDAEDTLVVVGEVLQQAADCVRRHGGRVLRYTGDGLKAGFGCDLVHEDDAEHALRAGLDILECGRAAAARLRDTRGIDGFALRVGAHTGTVALGAGVEDADTVSGEAVHVAARMEQSAPQGAFRVSAETWAHVRGRFVGEPQPPLSVKGVDEPLQTVLVSGWCGRAADGAPRSAAAPLIGRAAELARLLDLLRAPGEASPAPPALLLLAEAGLGKSRLLREALAAAQAQGLLEGRRVLQARAQPGGQLQAWGLLRQLLMGCCGVSDDDTAAQARERFVTRLAPGFGRDGELQAALVGQLSGLDFSDVPALHGLDARARHDRALAALRRWLLGTPTQPPALLVLEDLHWADEASLDWVLGLATGPGPWPPLWASARPALLERGRSWPPQRLLALQALDGAAGRALAHALLAGVEQPPAALVQVLAERADGNPYYMEELWRRLRDDGVLQRRGEQWCVDEARMQTLQVPTTLVGLLQARLDALPPPARQAACAASIVGAVFWTAALAEVDAAAPPALGELQWRHWVHAEPSAFADTAEHRFDHHLLHQVTYDTVPRAVRRSGHAAVARWLLQRTAERAPEFLAVAGEHAERAGDAALALDCYARAGNEARQRFANRLAIDCLERALAQHALLPEAEPSRRTRLLTWLSEVADVIGERALQRRALDELAQWLASHPDPAAQACHAISSALLADRTGDHDAAHGWATRAVELAAAAGPAADGDAALAHAELCWLHGLRGEHEQARVHQRLGAGHAERVRDTRPEEALKLHLMAGIVELRAGCMMRALHLLEEARRHAEAGGAKRLLIGVLDYLSMVNLRIGRIELAHGHAVRCAELARELGATPRVGHALVKQSETALTLGHAEQAADAAREGLRIAQEAGERWSAAAAWQQVGKAFQALGDPDQARPALAQAEALFEELAPGNAHALVLAALGARVDLQLGDTAAARAAVERVLAVLARGAEFEEAWQAIDVRWACCQVLTALADARAAPLAAALRDEVLALAAALRADGGDGEAMLQAVPAYRDILAVATPHPPPSPRKRGEGA